jgi:anti-sigma regulatory factor (Ser/Thr protein kinase)
MHLDEHWSHSTELEAADRSASVAREFVTRHLLEHDLGHLVDDVQLVASELATNAIAHAHTTFVVTLEAVEEAVRLEVLDGSPSEPVMVIARPTDTHGRGVAIVNALSSEWGSTASRSGGKSVWATFDKRVA